MPVLKHTYVLESAVHNCLNRGWSIIPLTGGLDPQRGKRPACRWQVYTRRQTSPAEIRVWFGDAESEAYGVICGAVSNLVVLDLDDARLVERFAGAFPGLLDTLMVRSGVRGMPHIYWRVDFPVRTRSFPGGDLKAEGSYVVGPGSVIGGCRWQVVTDRPVRHISREELDQVLAFLLPASSVLPESDCAVPGGDYSALYRFYVRRLGGRNDALFRTACYMRDHGCMEAQTVSLLAQVHAQQPSLQDGRLEAFRCRYAEAVRTIRSVYRRPARAGADQADSPDLASRYPNSVREALLKRADGAAIARTVEAARLRGAAPGAVMTEAVLCRLLKGLVSRETIRRALSACYQDGQPVFAPPDHPPAFADIPDGITRQKNAFLSAGQKQTAGRLFVLPGPETLCQHLGVQPNGSDPLTLEDVRSSQRYRQALHRALLRRRPGVYSQGLLALRLGVSSRSIRRYNSNLGVHAQPTYHETPVLWTNVEQIPPAGEIERYAICTGGQFLMDETGKKWPLKREIAVQLLSRGRRVSHLRQGCNYYWCGEAAAWDTEHIAAAPGRPLSAPRTLDFYSHPVGRDRAQRLWGSSEAHFEAPPAPDSSLDFVREGVYTASNVPTGVPRHEKASKRRFRQPLPDATAERAAQQVYERVAAISLPNARRLVDTYGSEPLQAALRRLRWLNERDKVTRPAGLLVTLARVNWRARQGSAASAMPAPRFKAEPLRRSRPARYIHPKDDPLWRSTTYRDWRAEFFGLDDALLEPTLEEIVF